MMTRLSVVGVFLLVVLPPFAHIVGAIRCNCSNSKGAAPCRDGVCAIGAEDERFAACVALKHSVTGMHYACAHRDSDEQECNSKVIKSGSLVTACFCSAGDFCNGLTWPPAPTFETKIVTDDNPQVNNIAGTPTRSQADVLPRPNPTQCNDLIALVALPVTVKAIAYLRPRHATFCQNAEL
uniref:Uncharacterized protein n=1 Tax=Plectus sambesii TaxID=2011161 RepID=A0A914WTK7_9BILA